MIKLTNMEKRIFCVWNCDDNRCTINNKNNKCKKLCKNANLCMNDIKEEEDYQNGKTIYN